MRIGVPRERKPGETRVGLTPAGTRELVRHGHRVMVERGAGAGSGFDDEAYARAGGIVVADAAQVWAHGDLVVKVKEPIASEYAFLRPDQVLFTYLHLAASRECTEALLAAGTTAIAYETVQLADGSLPLLAPMSEVAGRLATLVGANLLLRAAGGRGILPGGVAGAPKAKVVVIGGGTAGEHAAASALGLAADVTVFDRSAPRLRDLESRFGPAIRTRAPSEHAIDDELRDADLVIGSVLIPGAAAPKLVTLEMVSRMRAGSVLVDVAIDQGGCFEGSRPTTHDRPTFRVHGSTYYCVANMPAAVPVTSTAALTNATLPYVVELAERGWAGAAESDPALARAITASAGVLRQAGVADAFGMPWEPLG